MCLVISKDAKVLFYCWSKRTVGVKELCLTLIVGKYHCPVTYKIFNDNSHIVAIRTTGNVYSYEVNG